MVVLQHAFPRGQPKALASNVEPTALRVGHVDKGHRRPLSGPTQASRPRCVAAQALPEIVAALGAHHPVFAAVEIDWSDPDVQTGALGAFLGLALGIGTPIFYISRDRRDDERLEELRALNRATKQETGEYLSPEEMELIRPPRWTDRREFADDD